MLANELQIDATLDHLFRHQAGQMVSVLCRVFGFEKIDYVEDAVQDALVSALKTWPYSGQPENPRAWLLRAAKNRCIDVLRRANRLKNIDETDFYLPGETDKTPVYFANEISEDQLRMIFACCHPAISPDSQVALTLKTVGGFSVDEIANAFLSTRSAIGKMLTRAKQRLCKIGVRMEIPEQRELLSRVDAVQKVLYLMFNEGYNASAGDELIRKDLVFEAIRLGELLAAHPLTGSPTTEALLALFYFQGSRMASRADQNGDLLLLAEQDRVSWDKTMISHGLDHFRCSASGNDLSDYHLEAEIAAIYTVSPDYRSTDWPRILECYDTLQQRKFSPIVELNRLIVINEIRGPHDALPLLKKLGSENDMNGYSLYFVTKGHFLGLTDEIAAARDSYLAALELTHNEPIRRFILRKINELAIKSATDVQGVSASPT